MREINQNKINNPNVRLYYIYEDKKYYIENKETTTYRTTVEETLKVLNIVAPDNTVTENDLVSLATENELLERLYFTWSDTGSYMATIQLNDFKKHPLTLAPDKNKLYIMNSELVYDLTTNEAPLQRLQYIQNYYWSKLGLYVSIEDFTVLYNLLLSYYRPTPYNVIGEVTDTSVMPKYTNTIKLSNYNNSSPAIYTIVVNPYGEFYLDKLGEILSLQDKVITLTNPVDPTRVHVGDILTIKNTITYVENYPYYADGTYTVTEIGNNTITVDENFPTPYIYEPAILSVCAYTALIEKISREDNTITLDNQASLSSYLIGDTIHIKGTSIETPYQTLTVDGTYTIQNVSSHVITTEETPVTDYEYSTGTQPYIYKKIHVANISTITTTSTEATITLTEATSFTLTNSTTCALDYPAPDMKEVITNTTTLAPQGTTEVKVSNMEGLITDWTAQYGELNTRTPYTDTLITVEDTTKENVMPNTTFMVDDTTEATEYLELLSVPVTLTTPTEICYTNINKEVEKTITIPTTETITVDTMEFLGLYSEVYKDQTT